MKDFDDIFGSMGRGPSTSGLDFGGDPIKIFYRLGRGG